jgi:hypothetical protein
MEAKYDSKTSVDFQQNTWRFPEDKTIHNHCSETSNPAKSKAIYCVACSQITDTEINRNVQIKSPAHSGKSQK